MSAVRVGDHIDSDTLTEVLAQAWVTFVDPGALLEPAPNGGVASPGLVAQVAVRGETPAAIAIAMDAAGARAVAERMLAGVGVGVEEADVVDAMGELANVLGGNLKALLPDGSTLTLPEVSRIRNGVIEAGPDGDGGVVATLRWGAHTVTAAVTPAAATAGKEPRS
ncbi:MAG: chemotaxis protein CheX [Kineosporiaceae bacterium]